MVEDVREKREKNKGVLNKEPREHENQKSRQKSKQGRRKESVMR